jgi:hypothetical protein
MYLVLGVELVPGKMLPKKPQKEAGGCDWTTRVGGAGRWRKLSARAISTCRAIRIAV